MRGRNYLVERKTGKKGEYRHVVSSSLVIGASHHREKSDAERDTPLPKASYTVLKEKQIRDLLAAYDLTTSGDRSQLIARHERSVRPPLVLLRNIIMFPVGGLQCITQTSIVVLPCASDWQTSGLRCDVGKKCGGKRKRNL